MATLTAELKSRMEHAVGANQSLPGVIMHVDCPAYGLDWSGAAGSADKRTREVLTAQHTLRIASITKTFVAVGILRLYEQGRLGLDDFIGPHLSTESRSILSGGGYDPDVITIRQLLNHTSGIFDFGMAAPYDAAVKSNPSRRWTRKEQLQGAMQWGTRYGPPGVVYGYSDTGYILLGEIVERAASQPLGQALRGLIGYERIGLTSTWLESLEPAMGGAPTRAHQYLEGQDTYEWDPSMDLYGGGGLVSTVDDLARFFRALFEGRIFEHASTLEAMLTSPRVDSQVLGAYANATDPPVKYGLGIVTAHVDGVTVYKHGGYWGVVGAYVPELNLAVAVATTEQAFKVRDELLRDVIVRIKDMRTSPPTH